MEQAGTRLEQAGTRLEQAGTGQLPIQIASCQFRYSSMERESMGWNRLEQSGTCLGMVEQGWNRVEQAGTRLEQAGTGWNKCLPLCIYLYYL